VCVSCEKKLKKDCTKELLGGNERVENIMGKKLKICVSERG